MNRNQSSVGATIRPHRWLLTSTPKLAYECTSLSGQGTLSMSKSGKMIWNICKDYCDLFASKAVTPLTFVPPSVEEIEEEPLIDMEDGIEFELGRL